MESIMDHLEAGLVIDYFNRLNGLQKPGPKDEEEFYARHDPKSFRPGAAVSLAILVGVFLLAGLIV
jgi:hypothetical protein